MTSVGLWSKFERRLARLLGRRMVPLANKRPIVSFTFDDVPRSACVEGADILERHGALGTFYICGGWTTRDGGSRMHSIADLRRLLLSGHEIGCHGFAHPDYQAIGAAGAIEDMRRNLKFLEDLGVSADGLNFAYPFGCVSPRLKRAAGARYASARGVVPRNQIGRADLNCLDSVPLYSSTTGKAEVSAMIESNAKTGGWLIFFTHDVQQDPGLHGCTPSLLEDAVRCALSTGSGVLSIRDAITEATRVRSTHIANA